MDDYDELDLAVELAGLRLPNPLLLASGIADETAGSMIRAVKEGAGGVVTKSLNLEGRDGHGNPVVVEMDGGLINAMGLPNPGVDDFGKEIKEYLKETGGGRPIIGSVFGSDMDEYAETANRICRFGVKAVEINGSCPNAEGLGLEFGQDPDTIEDLVSGVKGNCDAPVFFKLTPNTHDIVALAKAAERGGADGVVAINTLKAMKIDIHLARPILTNTSGGLSGPAIKSVGVKAVYDIAKSDLGIPIIGVGGITGFQDAVEYIQAGATAVQIGTAVMWDNLAVFGEIREGMRAFMSRMGYGSVDEMIKLALEVA